MSIGFEKETKTSIVKSLLGAFSGLGAGFVLLFLGLAALANARSVIHSSESVRPIREQLEADQQKKDRYRVEDVVHGDSVLGRLRRRSC